MFSVGAYIEQRIRAEESTRAISLFRIAIAGLIFMRFGPEMSMHLATNLHDVVLSLAYFGFTGLMLVGLRTRLACVGVACVMGYTYFVMGVATDRPGWGHHHHYMLFIAAFLLCFAPCDRSFSVDRVLTMRAAKRDGAQPPVEIGPSWAQTLLVFQMAALYFWTAVDKTNAEFLRGDRLERIFEWVYAGTPLYELVTQRVFLATGSTFVVILEYVLPIMLLLRWRLPWAFAIALVLHIGFYVMLPVQTYSATMLAMYILVARPQVIHDAIDQYVVGKPSYANA